MKRIFLSILSVVVSVFLTCTVFLVGCFGNKSPENSIPKTYMISYTDDMGTHQKYVYAGMSYSLDVVPTKTGYTFTGLYDSESGGTQYVSASGDSLFPFADKKNIVLYPRFKAKDYTVILNYQGAAVTGSRQLTVSYDSSITDLPKNLEIEHKNFVGWFTEANCGGTQVADEYGSIPIVSILNDTNFDLSGASVTLYAGFEIEKYTVTFCFDDGMETEDIQVEYNTPINQVMPKTRKNGLVPLSWSETKGGNIWNGKVTGNMNLYAVEYAPIIEVDLNGGTGVNNIVARAGETISLLTPRKTLSEFAYWIDEDGNTFAKTVMPEESIKLTAVWRNKIVFNSNGGNEVNDISGMAGEGITLPESSKSGYVFAGWYTDNGAIFEANKIPESGISLKAGWYQIIKINKTYITNDKLGEDYDYANTSTFTEKHYDVDLSGYVTSGQSINVKLKLTFESTTPSLSLTRSNLAVDFYSDTVKLCQTSIIVHNGSQFVAHEINKEFVLTRSQFYMSFSCENKGGSKVVYFKNVKADIEIPDYNSLIL